jgi:cystathionine beta-lyase/cystathionine gamma-synthase
VKNQTFVNHPPEVDVPADNRALVAPIYQSVKFSFDDTDETLRYLRGEREGFYYSRSSNPTLRQLELTLAHLQGRDACLLVGSGVATVSSALLALCKTGDHVLAFVESYGPTRYCRSRIAPVSSARSRRPRRGWCCSRARRIPSTRLPTSST